MIDEKYLSAKGEFISKDNPVRDHARKGYEILVENNITEKIILNIVRYHHENWDGHGYPDNLFETNIPVEARTIAIVDSFDAICSNRPYRKGLPLNKAIDEMQNSSEKRFDPNLLKKYLSILKEVYSLVHNQS